MTDSVPDNSAEQLVPMTEAEFVMALHTTISAMVARNDVSAPLRYELQMDGFAKRLAENLLRANVRPMRRVSENWKSAHTVFMTGKRRV